MLTGRIRVATEADARHFEVAARQVLQRVGMKVLNPGMLVRREQFGWQAEMIRPSEAIPEVMSMGLPSVDTQTDQRMEALEAAETIAANTTKPCWPGVRFAAQGSRCPGMTTPLPTGGRLGVRGSGTSGYGRMETPRAGATWRSSRKLTRSGARYLRKHQRHR